MTERAPRAILVLGMHRSGTSAVTRVLNLLGADLGQRLMPPMPGSNEKGFWENLDAVDIDERLLAGIGRSWHDVRDLPAGWLQSAAAADASASIKGLIQAEFATTPLWAVKDPRMCRLAPLWLRTLAECDVSPHVLFVVRHPLEVAESLHARDGWPHARSLLLWLQHILEAERATRRCRRVMVTYDQLLRDWSRSMGLVSQALGVAWPRPIDDARAEIEAFLDVGARHHERSGPSVGSPTDAPGVPSLVDEVFEQCVRVSVNSSDWSDLEASADAFRRFSALYGACLDDFIGFANTVTGRVQHAGTIPVHARPDADALGHHARDLSRALTGLTADGADLAVIRSLSLHAGLVERLGRAVDEQWARIASLEALLFAEHQSLRAVIAGESHRIRSTATAESDAVRSELKENARLVHEEVEKLAQLLAGQADAIRSLQNELAAVRRGLVLPTLRRWLGRADG